MKIALALAGALSATLLAGPVQAADRIDSSTVIKVMPGDHVFHEGDPIRVCVMTVTEWRTEHLVTIVIEMRPVNKRKWRTVVQMRSSANSMGCLYGVTHKDGPDSFVRARTLTNPEVAGSMSRKILIDML